MCIRDRLQDSDRGRRLGDLCHHGRDLFRVHDDRRLRLSPVGCQPHGWTPPAKANAMISQNNVHLRDAHKTPQFWLIWWVLCLNVSAGIGVIGMASPMLQEIFAGKLIGLPDVGFNALSVEQKATIAGIAAGFAGLLSLFNIGGRVFWASLSDHIGRKNTYYCFFLLSAMPSR